MAPVFDLNLSMLPYIERSDWEHIGTKMRDYGPRIGEDFTRIGQQAMTSEIRAILIGMKSFQFSFRGDEKFEPERVKLMEQMIHKQIEALLSREVLYTKDVFVPEHSLSEEQEKPSTKTEPERQSADKEILAETLWKNQHLDQWFSRVSFGGFRQKNRNDFILCTKPTGRSASRSFNRRNNPVRGRGTD